MFLLADVHDCGVLGLVIVLLAGAVGALVLGWRDGRDDKSESAEIYRLREMLYECHEEFGGLIACDNDRRFDDDAKFRDAALEVAWAMSVKVREFLESTEKAE